MDECGSKNHSIIFLTYLLKGLSSGILSNGFHSYGLVSIPPSQTYMRHINHFHSYESVSISHLQTYRSHIQFMRLVYICLEVSERPTSQKIVKIGVPRWQAAKVLNFGRNFGLQAQPTGYAWIQLEKSIFQPISIILADFWLDQCHPKSEKNTVARSGRMKK